MNAAPADEEVEDCVHRSSSQYHDVACNHEGERDRERGFRNLVLYGVVNAVKEVDQVEPASRCCQVAWSHRRLEVAWCGGVVAFGKAVIELRLVSSCRCAVGR